MLTIDPQPSAPDVPDFHRQMEAFLVAVADRRRARRRITTRVYLTTAAVAAALALAVVIAVAHGGSSAGNPGHSPNSVRLASFSVTPAPGGLVRLTLTPGQLQDADALRDALAHFNVPALVTANSVCYVPGPNADLPQVLLPAPRQPDAATWLINPAAIPAGDELSIGYYPVSGGFGIHVTLVPQHASLTCAATPPAPPHQ